jgi:hypothetical protein
MPERSASAENEDAMTTRSESGGRLPPIRDHRIHRCSPAPLRERGVNDGPSERDRRSSGRAAGSAAIVLTLP